MATVKYTEFLDAFEFAAFSGSFENRAFIDLESGALHWVSDASDDEPPEDLESSDRYLELPHKNDLDLGRRLALSFIDEQLPHEYDRVLGYFHKRGAYSRFKDLLDIRGALQAWFVFERPATEQALKQWCDEHGIQLTFDDPQA